MNISGKCLMVVNRFESGVAYSTFIPKGKVQPGEERTGVWVDIKFKREDSEILEAKLKDKGVYDLDVKEGFLSSNPKQGRINLVVLSFGIKKHEPKETGKYDNL